MNIRPDFVSQSQGGDVMDKGILQLLQIILDGPKKSITPLYLHLVLLVVGIVSLSLAIAATSGLGLIILSVFITGGLFAIGYSNHRLAYDRPFNTRIPDEFKEPPTLDEYAAAVTSTMLLGNNISAKKIEAVRLGLANDTDKEEAVASIAELSQFERIEAESVTRDERGFVQMMISDEVDLDKIEIVYRSALADEEDPLRRIQLEILYLRARMERGDSSALAEIEAAVTRVKENPGVRCVRFNMAGLHISAHRRLR